MTDLNLCRSMLELFVVRPSGRLFDHKLLWHILLQQSVIISSLMLISIHAEDGLQASIFQG